MNAGLAQLLADRVAAALPFLDRVTGLVRLYAKQEADGDTFTTNRLPVPVSYTAADCERNDRYLVPGADAVGILFFEDGGQQPFSDAQTPPSLGFRVARLRLLLWLNPLRLSAPLSDTQLLVLLERALSIGKRFGSGDFLDISTTYASLPAETSLFGRYSFANDTPLLLPPYQVLGLDLRVQFRLSAPCLTIEVPTVIAAPLC